ncbi:endoglucanase [Vigna unguiculata]|uniref:Endoglucanase n=2 Tax=Vigna unguiculata TaxID=3917 RepID=A0A4D6LKB0_VIGUN|nr:endoglucanase [Vigna unguiculata]
MVAMMMMTVTRADSINYGEALRKSILFFEGQRSGKLPPSQRMKWRKDSALFDGSDIHIDMVGGYYDAGDNVKFHFPMAFTTTVLAWSVVEFGDLMGSEREHALDAIKWGTDYFMKATKIPDLVVAQVGNPYGDHDCWERPEDMDTPRTSYYITKEKPGSELAAEIAAALAASSIAFRTTDASYSNILLKRAIRVFDFANKYRGSYNNSVGEAVCPFYCDFNGYMDELVWGAAWLYKATKRARYWDFVKSNMQAANVSPFEFGWDGKAAGINVLVSEWVMNDSSSANLFIPNADALMCGLVGSPTKSFYYTKGGLLFREGACNLQNVTALSFLLIVYARFMEGVKKTLSCGKEVVDSKWLINIAKSQADYILGKNPLGMSYMVGYGSKYPQRIHHRGSVLPSLDAHPQHFGCRDGVAYFKTEKPNPNVLIGALVGGPAYDDSFQDSRYNPGQSEPTTYLNAPFVGVLAYLNKPNII